jgi:hypothetical protein
MYGAVAKPLGGRAVRRVRERVGLPEGGHPLDLMPIDFALFTRDAGGPFRAPAARGPSPRPPARG